MAYKPYYKNAYNVLVELPIYADRADKDGNGNNIAEVISKIGTNSETNPNPPEHLAVGGLYFELEVPKRLSGTFVTTNSSTTVSINQAGEKDWGDGAVNTSTTHRYARAGTYNFTFTSFDIDTIQASAFKNNLYLTSITIPETVTTIGNEAFNGTKKLEEINYYAINASDISSSSSAHPFFYSGQTGNGIVVNIGKKVQKIPAYLFEPTGNDYGYTYVMTVNFEENSQCTSIGKYAFGSCKVLSSINLPKSLVTIDEYAFHGCSGITQIKIYQNVRNIGKSAFSGNNALIELYNLSSLPFVIGDTTNYGGIARYAKVIHTSESDPSRLVIDNGVVYYVYGDEYNAVGLTNRLCTSVVISNSANAITSGIFNSLGNLTSVSIPGSVKEIPGVVADTCSKLQTLTLGEGIEKLNSQAFRTCAIKSVVIPASVTSITGNAFYGNPLTSISVASGNTHYDSRNNCNAVIETATNKLVFGTNNTVIPSNVTSIGSQAFARSSTMTSITIPSSVTSIENEAFAQCSKLTSITVPSSVTSIGSSTFAYCFAITLVKILSTSMTMGQQIFTSCSNLTDLRVGWSSGAVSGAPWGATNATITYNYRE